MEDGDILKYLWAGIVTVGGAAMTFLTSRATRSIDKLRDDVDGNERDLAAFKLHVSDTYARDSTMQSSLARIHDRIDEVATDIKTILSKVK